MANVQLQKNEVFDMAYRRRRRSFRGRFSRGRGRFRRRGAYRSRFRSRRSGVRRFMLTGDRM